MLMVSPSITGVEEIKESQILNFANFPEKSIGSICKTPKRFPFFTSY